MAHNSCSHRRRNAPRRASPTTRTASSRMTASAATRSCHATFALSVAAWSRWQASSRSRFARPPAVWSDLSLECSRAFSYSHKEGSTQRT